MSKFNDFLKRNPEVLSKYVTVGFTLVDKVVIPLNRFMKHLLEVQGIDPKTQPGETSRKLLAKVMEQVQDPEEFYEDFNIAAKGFDRVNAQIKHFTLTKDQYKKATDISHLNDPKQQKLQEELSVTKPVMKELEIKEGDWPPYSRQPYQVDIQDLEPSTASSLNDAIKMLTKYADVFQERQTLAEKANQAFEKGLFKRVEEYNDDEE